MRCYAYTTEKVEKGISPLYSIEIVLDGTDDIVNNLKEIITSNLTSKELIDLIGTLLLEFKEEKDSVGNSFFVKGEEQVTLSVNVINTISSLTLEDLYKGIQIENFLKESLLDKNTNVTFLPASIYDQLHPNSIGVNIDGTNIVIKINETDVPLDIKIKDFLNYLLASLQIRQDVEFDGYIDTLRHELLHQVIEISSDEKYLDYQKILKNPALHTSLLMDFKLKLHEPKLYLKLYLEGTKDFKRFFSEIFVLIELGNKDLKAVWDLYKENTISEEEEDNGVPKTEKERQQLGEQLSLFSMNYLLSEAEELSSEDVAALFKSKLDRNTYFQLSYKPWTEIDKDLNTYKTTILSLERGDVLYLEWTVDGNIYKPTPVYLTGRPKIKQDKLVLEVIGRKYDSKKEVDDREWISKTIYIDVDNLKAEQKEGKSKFSCAIRAFRKYAGKMNDLTSKGRINIDVEKNIDLKAAIEHNTFLWLESQKENNENPDTPYFYANGFGKLKHKKNDPVGLFFHVGKSNMINVKGVVLMNIPESESGFAEMTAENTDYLLDTTFNMLKTGDIVIYKTWNDKKAQYNYDQAVVILKYTEGLVVRKIDKNGNLLENNIPLNRNRLFQAYVFFNKDNKVLQESDVLSKLKHFDEEVKKIRDFDVEDKTKTSFNLKELMKLNSNQQHSILSYKYGGDFEFADSSYFTPIQEDIDVVLENSYYPSDKYYAFVREYENASNEEKKLLAELNPLYLNYMFCVNHRLNLTKTLRPGSWVMLNTQRWEMTADGKYTKRKQKNKYGEEVDLRATVYGFIIAASEKYITVATPRLVWDQSKDPDQQWRLSYNPEVWDFIEVNVTDLRRNKQLDIVRVVNNTAFNNTIISILENVKILERLRYNNDAEYVADNLKMLEKGQLVDFKSNKYFQRKDIGVNNFWRKINFFPETVFDKDNNITLDSDDLRNRQNLRLQMVSRLETGCIVMLRGKKSKEEPDVKINRWYMVIAKDLTTGMPILGQVKRYSWDVLGVMDKTYVKTFIPDINSIVAVGILDTTIDVERIEFDKSVTKIKINANDAFREDLLDLIKEYIKRYEGMTVFNSEKLATEKIKEIEDLYEKKKWKSKNLVLMKVVVIEKTTKDGDIVSKKILKEDFDNPNHKKSFKDRDWKIVPNSEKWAIYRTVKWDGKEKLIPYSAHSRYISFMRETNDKKNPWESAAGLRIVGDIKTGTILSIRDADYKEDMVNGIVLYKDDFGLTLLKLKDDILYLDSEDLTYADIEYYYLGFKTANDGTEKEPIYTLLVPNVRNVQFASGISNERFEQIELHLDAFKRKSMNVPKSDKLIYRKSEIMDAAVVKKALQDDKTRILMKPNIRYSKGIQLDTMDSIADLKKYLEKFEQLYGIPFEILSSKEIKEKFSKELGPRLAEQLLLYRAFKKNGIIYINGERASVGDTFHEMTHFVLEALKKTNETLYYNLLSVVKQHPLYGQIKQRYPELNGNELDEEVFSTVLGLTYEKKIKNNEIREWENKNIGLLDLFLDWLRELLSKFGKARTHLNNAEIINNSIKNVMYEFGFALESGNFIGDIKTTNKETLQIQSLKQKLIDDGTLTMYCV